MNIDRFFTTFKTASKGMDIQRRQLQVAAENIANANTTRVAGTDQPYKPKQLVFSQALDNEFGGLQRKESNLELRNTRFTHLSKAEGETGMGMAGRQLGPETELVEKEQFRYEYDPQHPDADENGMVKYPDLDLVEEMTRMVVANRLFEANLSVVEAEKQIIRRSFEI